jgi:uncharacterized membrane protein
MTDAARTGSPAPRRWRALTVSLVGAFMVLLDVGIVNVALSLRGAHGVSTPGFLRVGFGVVSVVMSWALVHILCTLRDAALHHGRPGCGID